MVSRELNLFLFAIALCLPSDAKKIAMMAMPTAMSHGMVAAAIAKKMSENHSMTIIAWTEDAPAIAQRAGPNVKLVGYDLRLDKSFSKHGLDLPPKDRNFRKEDMRPFIKYIIDINDALKSCDILTMISGEGCSYLLNDPRVRQAIEDADFLVLDIVFSCGAAASSLFKKKTIWYSPTGFNSPAREYGPSPSRFVPALGSRLSDNMSVLQSFGNFFLKNIFLYVLASILTAPTCELAMMPVARELGIKSREAFGETYDVANNLEDCVEILGHKRHSTGGLILVLSGMGFDFPRPIYSNVKVVGHPLSRPAIDLKKGEDGMKTFVDNADNGLVLISLGTFGILSQNETDLLARILSSLSPVRVLWKVTNKVRPAPALVDPSQIKIVDWMPQNDILGHKNCRAFLTHGGRNSIEETSYHGIPIIGIPLLGDQFDNLLRAQERGYGVIVNRDDLTEESLREAFSSVLSPEFRAAAKKMSRSIRAHPRHSLDLINDWIEYAMNADGAIDDVPKMMPLSMFERYLPEVIVIATLSSMITALCLLVLSCFCGYGCSACKRRVLPSIKEKEE